MKNLLALTFCVVVSTLAFSSAHAAVNAANGVTDTKATPGDRECVWVRDISGFHAEGDTLVLRVFGGREYAVTFTPYCQSLSFARRIAFARHHGPEFCAGDEVLVDRERCWSDTVTRTR